MNQESTTTIEYGVDKPDENCQLAMNNNIIDILVTVLDAYDELIDAVVNNNVLSMNEKLKPIPIYSINKHQYVSTTNNTTNNTNMNPNSFVELSCSLLHMVDEFNWSLLQHACHHNCVDCVLELVSTLGVSIVTTNPNPYSNPTTSRPITTPTAPIIPNSNIIYHNNTVWNRILCEHMRTMELHMFNDNTSNSNPNTVLHTAMNSMHYDIIECLLNKYNMRSAIIGIPPIESGVNAALRCGMKTSWIIVGIHQCTHSYIHYQYPSGIPY